MANCCHASPGIRASSEPLPCTTSSCDSGSTKFSVNAYISPKVIRSWCQRRCTGSCVTYSSVSCIHPMFHLKPKPRPPACVGRDTAGHAVDSSAIVMAPGWRPYTASFSLRRNAMASRFSLPPWRFGSHSPALRE